MAEDRKKKFSPKRFSSGHPVRGYFNYIVGQLCANSNVMVIEEDATDKQIEKQSENIIKAAKLICDKVHHRNKNRYEDNDDE